MKLDAQITECPFNDAIPHINASLQLCLPLLEMSRLIRLLCRQEDGL